MQKLCGVAEGIEVKESFGELTGKGRGEVDARLVTRCNGVDASPQIIGASTIQEGYEYFCTHFVRLLRILFARTSIEPFTEVLTVVNTDLSKLLSSKQDEELNRSTNTHENALAIIKIDLLHVFTVYNMDREPGAQTYTEMIQQLAADNEDNNQAMLRSIFWIRHIF